MSMPESRYLELSNPESGEHKFYELTWHADGRLQTRYGRIGSRGQRKEQQFDTPEALSQAVEKTTAQKLAKGYRFALAGEAEAQETRHQRTLRCARTLYGLMANGQTELAAQCSALFKQSLEDEDNKADYAGQYDELVAFSFLEAANHVLLYRVDWSDTESMLEALADICDHLGIDIVFDWACDNPEDDLEVGQIMWLAHEQLMEQGFALWHWDAGDDAYLGWIARDDDRDAVSAFAVGLGLDARYCDPDRM